MDFGFSDEQLAVREAATGLFDGLVDPDGIAAVEAGDERIDRTLWRALADADLLGLAVPTEHGGAGLGITELCILLEAQGACVAPVPLWATLVLGARALARFAPPGMAAAWLPGVVAGDVLLTAALSGTAQSVRGTPPVRAEADGDGWVFDGHEPAVPHAHVATRILVPAHAGGGDVVLALVDPAADGVSLERALTTNREVHPHLTLAGARVPAADVVAGPGGQTTGADALGETMEAAWTGLAALALGVAASALAQAATYVNNRFQFDRPLSSFQAVLLRGADAAIDIEAMRVTLWQAAWRIDTGRPAAEAVAVAKYEAAERGQRVVHSTQHLHGGLGADVTYPIHRYFLWNRQIELLLGGPSRQLARLAAAVAARYSAAGGQSAPADAGAGTARGGGR